MSNFGKNIRYLRKLNNMSQDKLAEKLGYKSFTTIQKWESGNSEPSLKKLNQLADIFNVDIDKLATTDLTKEEVDLKDIPGVIPVKNIKKIPILGRIVCGEPILSYQNIEGYFLGDPDIIQADFALICQGDSVVDADIYQGDLVFIRQTPNVENGTIAAVLIDDSATLKRFYKNETQIILQPENKAYSPIIISKNDMGNIRILGQMVGVYSKRNR